MTPRFSALALVTLILPAAACGHELTGRGLLATETMGRCPHGGDVCRLGDMIHVTMLQRANHGGAYVSAHMEYRDDKLGWLPVPTAKSPIGAAYTSAKYHGLRDFVWLDRVSMDTPRGICLFIPYDAALLPVQTRFERRYVIRLWDERNHELSNLVLNPQTVVVGKQGNQISLRVATYTTVVLSPFWGPRAATPLEPKAVLMPAFYGTFDTDNGNWVQP